MTTYILIKGTEREETVKLILPNINVYREFVSLEKILPVQYNTYQNEADRFFRYDIIDRKKWLIAKLKYGLVFEEYEDNSNT